jgi:hypothetical protein
VIWAARVRVPIREHQVPAMYGGRLGQLVDAIPVRDVKGEMIEPRAASLVLIGGHCR